MRGDRGWRFEFLCRARISFDRFIFFDCRRPPPIRFTLLRRRFFPPDDGRTRRRPPDGFVRRLRLFPPVGHA